jgi:hypothetical protein
LRKPLCCRRKRTDSGHILGLRIPQNIWICSLGQFIWRIESLWSFGWSQSGLYYNQCQLPRPTTQNGCPEAFFNSIRVLKAISGTNPSKFRFEALGHMWFKNSGELNTVLWISLQGGQFFHYFQYRCMLRSIVYR